MTIPEPKLRTLREALDECHREFNVRVRCFPQWIDAGKLSHTDAVDRQDRLFTAISELEKLQLLREDANEAK